MAPGLSFKISCGAHGLATRCQEPMCAERSTTIAGMLIVATSFFNNFGRAADAFIDPPPIRVLLRSKEPSCPLLRVAFSVDQTLYLVRRPVNRRGGRVKKLGRRGKGFRKYPPKIQRSSAYVLVGVGIEYICDFFSCGAEDLIIVTAADVKARRTGTAGSSPNVNRTARPRRARIIGTALCARCGRSAGRARAW